MQAREKYSKVVALMAFPPPPSFFNTEWPLPLQGYQLAPSYSWLAVRTAVGNCEWQAGMSLRTSSTVVAFFKIHYYMRVVQV